MLGTVPGTWDTPLNKISRYIHLCGIDILMGRQAINHEQSLYVNYSMLAMIRRVVDRAAGEGEGWKVQGGCREVAL